MRPSRVASLTSELTEKLQRLEHLERDFDYSSYHLLYNIMSKISILQPSPQLLAVVQDKCDLLKLVYTVPAQENLTTEEKSKAEKICFPKELEFTVDPKTYVIASKNAFKNFVHDLPSEISYNDLWNQQPHDPHAFPYQMGSGEMDVKSMLISTQSIGH